MRLAHYIAYAVPALPLALFALPLYVHLPKLYSEHAGLPLAVIGAALLAARLLDAILDPLIGRWYDRHRHRKLMLLLALPLLLAGGYMLFLPPADAGLTWLLCGLVLAYGGYSLAVINHQAWGAEFPLGEGARLRATAWREGAALLGVLLAAGLPAALADTLAAGVARLYWLFVPVLCISVLLAVIRVPPPLVTRGGDDDDAPLSLWRSAAFRHLIVTYGINGIAAAIPATLVLFYVDDVLKAGAWSGVFLLLASAVLPHGAAPCGWPWPALPSRPSSARAMRWSLRSSVLSPALRWARISPCRPPCWPSTLPSTAAPPPVTAGGRR
jgi:Na+/melibiose symporter-like transporter